MTMRRRGTTLIELIVVLAIVALLFGVAVPAMTAVPGPPAEAAADRLRLAAVRSGRVARGDSLVALPDGRTLARGGPNAR